MKKIAKWALVTVALLAAGAVFASGGRVPIHSAPVTITEPGSYYLSRSIVHSGADSAITIAADNVTLDLMGHTLRSTGTGYAVIRLNGRYTDIVVRNGMVRGGSVGVWLANTEDYDFQATVEGLTIRDCAYHGIFLDGRYGAGNAQARVFRNRIHDVEGYGILLRRITGGRVEDNEVQDAGYEGIKLDTCYFLRVARNAVTTSRGGLLIDWSIAISVVENTLSDNSDWGMHVKDSSHVVYRENMAYRNIQDAIVIDGGSGNIDAGGNYPAASVKTP